LTGEMRACMAVEGGSFPWVGSERALKIYH